MVGTTEEKVIGKDKELFYLYLSLHYPPHTARHCFSFHDGENCDIYRWGGYQILLYLCGCRTWSNNDSLDNWMQHDSRSRIISKNGVPQLLPTLVQLLFPPLLILLLLVLLFNWFCICANIICDCCICCTSWGNIWVDWLVVFVIWSKVSPVP